MALNDPSYYLGGGVYVPTETMETEGLLIKPSAGTALLHHGDIRHRGMPVTGGARYVLVGFFRSWIKKHQHGDLLNDAAPPKTPATPKTLATLREVSFPHDF